MFKRIGKRKRLMISRATTSRTALKWCTTLGMGSTANGRPRVNDGMRGGTKRACEDLSGWTLSGN